MRLLRLPFEAVCPRVCVVPQLSASPTPSSGACACVNHSRIGVALSDACVCVQTKCQLTLKSRGIYAILELPRTPTTGRIKSTACRRKSSQAKAIPHLRHLVDIWLPVLAFWGGLLAAS